jgi:hypothetical protein
MCVCVCVCVCVCANLAHVVGELAQVDQQDCLGSCEWSILLDTREDLYTHHKHIHAHKHKSTHTRTQKHTNMIYVPKATMANACPTLSTGAQL